MTLIQQDSREPDRTVVLIGIADDWDLAVNALASWGVLLPDVATLFRNQFSTFGPPAVVHHQHNGGVELTGLPSHGNIGKQYCLAT